MAHGPTPCTWMIVSSVVQAGFHPTYNDTTLSAATTFSANSLGLTNCACLPLRSSSVTPRATEHLPQTKIGTRWATTSSSIAFRGAMATGITESAMTDFMR
jgi:hypothetical protein